MQGGAVMDFSLSESQKMIIHSADSFFKKNAKDFARNIEKEESQFSMEFWLRMNQLGFQGMVFPEEYGGTAGDFVDFLLLMEEFGKALVPGPLISTVISGLAILNFGTEEQKKKYLPAMIEEGAIMTPALIAPKLDGRETKTAEVTEASGSWVITGTKLFVPYAHLADWILYQSESEKGKDFYIVDARSEGVQCTLLKTMAFDGLCQVSLDRAKIPLGNRLGEIGKGEEIALRIGEWGALAQSGFIVGQLEKMLALVVDHAKQREQFGKPIGSFQAIQHQCADMLAETDKAKFLAYQAAWKLSQGMSATREISMAKARASDASRKVSLLGVKIHGGVGISEEHDVQIYFRRAKAAEVSFGDGLFHREIIAREMGL
jgi:alkylation response protein AidB-like acyl-CoA dehydrogenase